MTPDINKAVSSTQLPLAVFLSLFVTIIWKLKRWQLSEKKQVFFVTSTCLNASGILPPLANKLFVCTSSQTCCLIQWAWINIFLFVPFYTLSSWVAVNKPLHHKITHNWRCSILHVLLRLEITTICLRLWNPGTCRVGLATCFRFLAHLVGGGAHLKCTTHQEGPQDSRTTATNPATAR